MPLQLFYGNSFVLKVIIFERMRVEAVPGQKLIPFGTKKTDVRDLGLAYGELAERGDPFYRSEAFRLLQEALPLYPKDPELLTRLPTSIKNAGT